MISWTIIGIILVSLTLSAFFSGIEIAYFTADRLQIELRRQKGSGTGKILGNFFKRPSKFLGTTLVGNNIALVIFGLTMGDEVINKYLGTLGISSPTLILLLSTLSMTLILLIFGEFLPKLLFRLNANRAMLIFAYPLQFFNLILSPLVWLMIKSSNAFLRVVFKLTPKQAEQVFTKLDLENFVKSSRTDSSDEIDQELFSKALHINEIRVGECMIPRTEIEAVDMMTSVEELTNKFVDTRLSKIIIYDNSLDEIKGYVHHQQLLKRPKDIRSVIMPIPLVPEVMIARDLMNVFIKDRASIAWVVDEFGGTAGIVTLEDILEEIFGEIEDEHDEEDYLEEQISDNEYRFSGRLEIDYLNEKFNLGLPEGEYHTVSGYIVTTTEQIPEQGKKIILDDYEFILESVSDTKIETVKLVRVFHRE